MKTSAAWGLLLASLACFAAASERVTSDFESDKPGSVPAGWSVDKTREGPGSLWQVLDDQSAPSGTHVVAQVSDEGAKPQYNLCIFDRVKAADVAISVKLKPRAGQIDQGGGLAWRYRDARNYYVCRWNPLENNFRLYLVADGKRTQMDTAKVKADPARWHTLRIVHVGREIRCWLDDALLLEAENDDLSAPGRAGLWTKSDAVTNFDDFSAGPATADDVAELP
jgi:hypothetical protein